jgi:hypothetical protein
VGELKVMGVPVFLPSFFFALFLVDRRPRFPWKFR